MIYTILILSTHTHTAQRDDQQPSEDNHSHVGSRGHAPQHSSQAEGRDECTVNGAHYSNPPSSTPNIIIMFCFVSESIHSQSFATGLPLKFSKAMNHDRLAEWLTNLLGDDYQRDISKLRGTYTILSAI